MSNSFRAFGTIKAIVRPIRKAGNGRFALTELLNTLESMAVGPVLQRVDVDFTRSSDITIQLLGADNWGDNLENCATRLLEVLSRVDSCKDVQIRFSEIPVTAQISSEAHKSRIRADH